jgi:hypothetical protein
LHLVGLVFDLIKVFVIKKNLNIFEISLQNNITTSLL